MGNASVPFSRPGSIPYSNDLAIKTKIKMTQTSHEFIIQLSDRLTGSDSPATEEGAWYENSWGRIAR